MDVNRIANALTEIAGGYENKLGTDAAREVSDQAYELVGECAEMIDPSDDSADALKLHLGSAVGRVVSQCKGGANLSDDERDAVLSMMEELIATVA